MVSYRLDIKIGDFLDGRYSVAKKIGSGSYGDVFKVSDPLGNNYALKLLRLWEVSEELREPLIKKFEQEYKTGRITSENLIHSLDFGIIKGNPYLVMEYCPQGDLSGLKGKDLSLLPYYAKGILEGLHKLHSEGKIHRDLKPENVLIRSNGKAALTDFGVVGEMDKAKNQSEKSWWTKKPKQIQGTPLYMAPEMFDRMGGGITYLPTIDIWSFGVMMYEILTGGSFPFGDIEKAEELPGYQERAKQGNWDSSKLKRSRYGKDWIHVISRCLEPDYQLRFQSALEVLKALEPLIGNVNNLISEEHKSRSPFISKLVITQGDNLGTTFILSQYLNGLGRMLRIGRENSNDIVIPERNSIYISRFHFTLEKSKDGLFWIIRDGQWRKNEKRWVTSTNGTYINATRVSSDGMKVFTGDIITVGEFKIKIY